VHDKDIDDHKGLAEETGVGLSTLYRAFDKDWSPRSPYASDYLLAALASYFEVPLNRLVVEPVAEKRRLSKAGKVA
jgi:hypothetical protein